MPARGATLAVRPDGVAVITIENGPMNALHPLVLRDLFTHLADAHERKDVVAVVLIGAGHNFSAGFDITLFKSGSGDSVDGLWVNRELCRLAEGGPKPVVAALRGLCLGGGCEVAISCTARVGEPSLKMGLPELQLGIIPGFGGTQRLPRLTGCRVAVPMMLTSRPAKAKEALASGLIDHLVRQGSGLEEEAARYALEVASRRKPWLRTLERTDRLEPYHEALSILDAARAKVMRTTPNLTHPLLCLDAVKAAVTTGGWDGVVLEGQRFLECQSLPTHAGLVHMFFAKNDTKRVKGVTDQGQKPKRQLRSVAVIGGGLMGSGIATACLLAGMRVVLKEAQASFLEAGMGRIGANLASRVKKGQMSESDMQKALGSVSPVLDYAGFDQVDIVIEAVIEHLPLKQSIFKECEARCRPDCILSTNTSTIDITKVGASMQQPQRLVGVHFFSPAHVMPLLEIIRTPQTPKEVLVDCIGLAGKIGKVPVVVGNCTGFAVNRVFFPYTMAATMLVDMGADVFVVDQCIAGFGMPMGPFRLADLVGGDISLHVGRNFIESFPERVYKGTLIPRMNEAKRLGEKTKGGYYDHSTRPAKPAREAIAPHLAGARADAKLDQLLPPKLLTPEFIVAFILFPVVNEACRVVAESMVDKPGDLDVASVLGMGFPAYRGGILHWADHVGAETIVAQLQTFMKMVPKWKGFFEPCAYLLEASRSGRKLGDGVGRAQEATATARM